MSTAGVDIAQLVDLNDWIAYQGPGPDGSAFVFLMHPDGTERHKIGEDVGAFGLPDWSPRGTKRRLHNQRGSHRTVVFL